MSWIKFDDAFPDHPKITGLTDKAFRIWVTSIAYSNRFGLDGKIPKKSFCAYFGAKTFPKRAEKELICAKLWQDLGEFWTINSYLEYQPSKSQLDEIRAKKAEAGRKGGVAKALADARGGGMPPSRPDPTRPVDRECISELEKIEDNAELTGQQIDLIATPRFGRLGGKQFAAISRLCPIRGWEIKAALAKNGIKYWGGLVSVLTEIREESAKPKPPQALQKQTGFSDTMQNLMEYDTPRDRAVKASMAVAQSYGTSIWDEEKRILEEWKRGSK